jgi:hypothetical protein
MENSPRIRWKELALQVVLSIISAFLGAFFATGGIISRRCSQKLTLRHIFLI